MSRCRQTTTHKIVDSLGVASLLGGVACDRRSLTLLAVNNDLVILRWLVISKTLSEGVGVQVECAGQNRRQRHIDRGGDATLEQLGRLADVDDRCVLSVVSNKS